MPRLSDTAICARIAAGKSVIATYAMSDQTYSSRYLDPSSQIPTVDPSMIQMSEDNYSWNQDVPQGVPNSFLINVCTKLSAICVNDPDFRVLSADKDVPNVMRSWMRQVWQKQDVTRTCNKAAQKWMIAGLGIVRYLWDPEMRIPDAEFVQSWNFFHDPNVKSWRKLKWAGCTVTMSKEDAEEYYGPSEFQTDPELGDAQSVTVDIYWDSETEAHVANGKVLKREKNLYGRPPFHIIEGDANPNPSRYPIGDGRTTAGVAKMMSDLYQMMANTTLNGGPVTFVNTTLLQEDTTAALKTAIDQGVVPVRDNPENVYKRIGSEPLSPAALENIGFMQRALDASMGVTAFQRGQSVEGTTTATETMAMVQQSGSRGVEARMKYERFIDDIANTFVHMQCLFGGLDDSVPDQDPGELLVWHAAQMTDEIHIVEGSTVFKDPNMDQQAAMTLFNLSLQATPVMAQALGKVPDLARLYEDVLTAFGRRDAPAYVIDAPAAPAAPEMQPMPPDGGEPAPMEGMNA